MGLERVVAALLAMLIVAAVCGCKKDPFADCTSFGHCELKCPERAVPKEGSLSAHCQLPNGKKHGPAVGFHSNGRVKERGLWKEGAKDGVWVAFEEDGQVAGRSEYRDALLYEGLLREQVRDCVVEGTVRDGLAEGEFSFRCEGGTDCKGSMKSSLAEGLWACNVGEKRGEVTYVQGREHGEMRLLSKDGMPLRVLSYRDGRRLSKVEWGESGTKVYEATYKDGLLDGTETSWHDGGELFSRCEYDEGTPVGACTFLKTDGSTLATSQLSNGSGRWVEPFPTGEPELEGPYKNGQKNGKWVWHFTPNGSRDEFFCKAGRRNGEARTYIGKHLWMKGDYSDGERSGIWTVWDLGGAKTAEGAYQRSLRCGRWKCWEPTSDSDSGTEKRGKPAPCDPSGRWLGEAGLTTYCHPSPDGAECPPCADP